MQRFANPHRFLRLGAAIQPWTAALAVVTGVAGVWLGLVNSPADYQQGDTVRIMYVHVPAAWMAMFVYSFMAGAAAVGLIWKHPLADLAAKAAAPVGAGFCFLALVTGSLWGKPMWGTYWVWDARLTSMLVLFFLYLGAIALVNAFDDPTRGLRASAILILVGFVNVPIIKFSVDWWHTLHQGASIVKMGGPSVHPSMLAPLLLMAASFTFYFGWLLLIRLRNEVLSGKVRAARLRQTRPFGEAA